MANEFVVNGRLRLDTSDLEELPLHLRQAIARSESRKAKVEIDEPDLRRRVARAKRELEKIERDRIRPKVDTREIDRATQHTERLQRELKQTGREAMGMRGQLGSAFAGGIGATITGMAGQFGIMGIAGVYSGTVGRARQQSRLESIGARTYGAEKNAEFVSAAKSMQESTGFLAKDFLQADQIMRTLNVNYGINVDQIKELVKRSADLAAISPYEDIQTVANAAERVQSAIRGEAEASERLGLTLNDNYLKNIAFGGALKNTWEKMSDLEKAQYRYQEILNQTSDISGVAADETDKYGRESRKAAAAFSDAAASLGEKVLPILTKLLELINALPDWAITGGLLTAGGVATAAVAGGGIITAGAAGNFFGNVAGEAGGEVAGGLGRKLLGKGGKKAAKEAGEEIAEEVAEEVAEGALRSAASGAGKKGILGALARLLPSAGGALAGIAGSVALPIIATAGAGTAIGLDAYGQHVEGLEREVDYAGQRNLTQRYVDQMKYGIDYGVYQDPTTGEIKQGTSQGWDQGAMIPIYGTRNIGGKTHKYIQGYRQSTEINKWGYELGSANKGYMAANAAAREAAGAQVTVVLEDRTAGGVQATTPDVGAFTPDNQ